MTPPPVATASLSQVPDALGRFGGFGGRYVPETLSAALDQLEQAYAEAIADPAFAAELDGLLSAFVGRPTPLLFAERLTKFAGGARIFFKREDLSHTGAHKINNTLGQGLLAIRMGKRRVIAETGAGQHGVATATACARFGLDCVVYMGSEDVRRQAPNVRAMRLMGAEVRPVETGSRTLRDAINEAMRDWMGSVETTHYIIGSVVGPHPFPRIVRDFQAVIGRETVDQCRRQFGRLPDTVVACVGGGSNAAGMFYPFVDHPEVRLVGVEAGGRAGTPGDHAASLSYGSPGILHGSLSYVLQDQDGQTSDVHSVSAGLDYPGVGPEHALLRAIGRVTYTSATDDEALDALRECCSSEGILPAIESSHAFAGARKWAAKNPGKTLLIGLSGRGDKDMPTLSQVFGGARKILAEAAE